MIKTKALAAIASMALIFAIGTTADAAGPTAVGLGTATSFAVLAGSGITNTGATVVNGDIGSFPTTTITGFPPGTVTAGNTNHGGDAVTQGAKTDLVTAYNDAAGRTPATTVPTELGGTTLTAGVYTSAAGTFGITGALTLSGDASSVFIFQMASTLTTATGSSVVLIGGAQSCNIFWQVGSSATLGGSTTFRGNVLALTSITLVTGATVDGRLLARNGAVTLDTNTITKSTCAAAPTSAPTVAPTAASSPHPPTAAPVATVAPTAAPVATVAPTAAPVATVAPTAAPVATVAPTAAPVATVAPTVLPVSQLPSTSTVEDNSLIALLAVMLILFAVLYMVVRARRRTGTVQKTQ